MSVILGVKLDQRIWKARHGDRAALDELVREYYPRVYGLCFRMLGNEDAARDAAQEAFARILRSLHHYREKARFTAWVLSIAANVVRDLLRKERKTLSFSEAVEESLAGGDEPDRLIDRQEDQDRIRAAFQRLPADDQLLLLQAMQQGLSRAEIAEVLGISVNAARIRLHRALELLRRCVQEVRT